MTVPPAQVVLALGAGATVRPVGRLSTTDTFTNGVVFVFCKVTVRVDIPRGATASGVNVLLAERSLKARTVKVAVVSPSGVRFWSFVILEGGMILM